MLDASWQEKKKAILSRRYLVWAPMALVYCIAFFHRNAGALVGEYIKVDFDITSAAQLGLFTSIFFYCTAIMQIPTGIIADKFDPKKGIMAAMSLIILGTAVSALTHSLTVLYIGRTILSVGAAMIFINMFKISANWWRTAEMGTISSFTSLSGNMGPLIATVPLAYIIRTLGWRGSYWITAGVVLLAMGLCFLFTKSSPADAGLPTWNEIEAKERGEEVKIGAAKPKVKIWDSLKAVVSNRQSIFSFFACVGIYGSYIAFAGFIAVPYFVQIWGMTRIEASQMLFVGQITYMIAGPLNGILSDKLKLRQRLLCGYAFVGFFGWLLFAFWGGGKPPMWGMYLIMVLIAIGASPLFMALTYAKEVNAPNLAGIAAGVANMGSFIGAGVLQFVMGLLLERYWDGTMLNNMKVYSLEAFRVGFFCCVASTGVAFLATLMMVETRCKNVYAQLVKKDPVGTESVSSG